MQISIIIPFVKEEINQTLDCINSVKVQSIKQNQIELILFNTENEVLNEETEKTLTHQFNDLSVINTKLKPNDLNGKYVFIYDRKTKINKQLLEVLLRIADSGKYDCIFPTENTKKLEVKPVNMNDFTYSDLMSMNLMRTITLKDYFVKNKIQEFNYFELKYFQLRQYFTNKNIGTNDVLAIKNTEINDEYIHNQFQEINYLFVKIREESDKDLQKFAYSILIKQLIFLVDKKIFVDEIDEEIQIQLLELLQLIIKEVNLPETLKNIKLEGYKGFFAILNMNKYTEAISYMKLFRSKRYQYHTANKYSNYLEKHPGDPSEDLTWKMTKPLRIVKPAMRKVKGLIFKYLLLLIVSFYKLLYLNKVVWLVCERADQAEDNGYFFFKYCREQYPNRKIYYIIEKNSPHYDKVAKLGNIIHHSSFKHKIYTLLADVYVSAWTFSESGFPNPSKYFTSRFREQLKNKFQVCIQHGVIIHNISPYLSKKKYQQNLIIASSEFEKEIIMETLNYPSDEVEVTGLARFDNLHDAITKRQILIMPTWRRHLFKINKKQFSNSEYFKTYKKLISNKKFQDFISKENIQVKFYIHHQMQRFLENFIVEHPNIEFLLKKDAKVSDLLKESKLLLTDYSSVSSDFFYMNKPVVFYQFDPHKNHHAPTEQIKYSDLGIIVNNEEKLLDEIIKISNRDFTADQVYQQNSRKIFKYKDTNNSKRIFEAIETSYHNFKTKKNIK
ncbi:CDP-glycerol glycerophosphotransferase family protein [Bacillus sp. UNCCL81]|uniref:CDP-glycerol glycerophosphotransferase family protein n=1 Tax=Bacillus sp. UNCCL81 TaxID=1502755 RepID=UPI0008F0DFFF|nr:CDP-glycerol glycerophosphotransferase family protein [Bacillus sp. UNCCL81]SFD10301.1 CDP-glycerol glycerophosphotransferase, TagB/SpsB family [Bacillus sp. UNCCL81]